MSLVQDFSPKSEAWFEIDGETYSNQNGNLSYSVALNDDTFRFEVHPDDLWKPGSTTSERSEIRGETVYQPGDILDVSYGFMIEPGAANTATGRGGAGDWLIVGQFHADDYESQPPFAIEMLGEKMAIIIRYGDPTDSKYRELYVDSQPIERGHYYDMRIEVRFENNGNGFLHIWRDGEEIVNYSGPLGYDNGVYWKYGIYRSETDTKIAVNYRDMSFHKEGDADGVVVVGTPAGDQITDSTTPAGQPALTNDGDKITGGGGSDVVVAGSGSDKVIGSKGNDVLTGGDGNDLLNGGAGKDKIFGAEANDKLLGGKGKDYVVGAAGDDVLKGGSGKDTFFFATGFGNDKIVDFKIGQDLIRFDPSVFSDYAELRDAMSSFKGGVLIHAGDDTLFLDKVKFSKVADHDFMFA